MIKLFSINYNLIYSLHNNIMHIILFNIYNNIINIIFIF